MNRISDTRKCMASMAVFRELYNSKNDIYAVISEFVYQIILERGLHQFELQDIKTYLNLDYGFELPSAVVKPALKRLKILSIHEKTHYTVKEEFNVSRVQEFKLLCDKIQSQNNVIFDSFLDYIKQNGNGFAELSEETADSLKKAFCSYILDECSSVDYSELISAFLISRKKDTGFVDQLNLIKQGLIIYVGLSYNVNVDSFDSIDTALHIYLETEVLFSLAGYNGQLYKILFDEFYEQAQQINRRSKKKYIYFHYFEETKNEIDKYFAAAEQIVRGNHTLNPSKQAMTSIVNGCKYPSDIVDKQTSFYNLLANKNITLDSQDNYYEKENVKYTIQHSQFDSLKNSEWTEEEIYRKARLLDYINVKRGTKSQLIFKNIGYILLSANRLTFKIAYDPAVRKESTVPLATSLDFLTNRFWLSLNKGLQTETKLHSFDIITKAQIALSSKVSEAVGRLYNEYQKEELQGKWNKEQQKIILAGLHKSFVSPEDLSSENETCYLNVVSIDTVRDFLAEQSLLNENLRKAQEKLDSSKRYFENLIQRKDNDFRVSVELLCEKRNESKRADYLKYKQSYKQERNRNINKEFKKRLNKELRIVFYYISFVMIIFFLSKIKLDKMSATFLTFFVGFVPFAVPFIRPFVNHSIIKDAFAFCLSFAKRKVCLVELKRNYENSKPMQPLKLYTIDDICTELDSRTK